MKYHLPIAACALLCLASCVSAPKLSDSWRAPDVHEFQAHKTLVIAMSSEASFRRVAEDEFVHQLGPTLAVPSYDSLAAADLSDTKKAAELARAQGCDSALVLRVLGVDEVQQRVPASTPVFVTFSGQNFGTAYFWPNGYYDEGFTYLEKTFRLETNLFSLAEDKLVWSGVVLVRDPDSVKDMVAWDCTAVLPELRRLKLVR